MHKSVRILGVRVDDVSEEEALKRIQRYVEVGTPHQVVTVNPEFVVMAQRDGPFRSVLEESHLALADGVGLLWAARLLGTSFKARLTGVDMVKNIARMAAERGYGIFLLGAKPGVAEAARQALMREYPLLTIVGTHAGSHLAKDEVEIIARVRAASPHFLFVAYGAPAQELWISHHLTQLGVPVAMGVGGALDYISGLVPRSPLWMRRFGLEWLFRLGREPWRWRRMLRLPYFVGLVMKAALAKALYPQGSA
ncbi:MAG: WecB/TagA/CpsF family glycosyltransferase [Chloroflexi bacterium]|nr:WecB/TagA/CpsF family glycosyltransferase [Chloroflexota bacterium]